MVTIRLLIIALAALALSSAPTAYTPSEKQIAKWAYNCGYDYGIESITAKIQDTTVTVVPTCARLLDAFGMKQNGEPR